MMSVRPMYEVVSPLGKHIAERIPLAPAVPSLEDKTIGFVWNGYLPGDTLADAFIDLLGKRFKGLKSIKLPSRKDLKWGEHGDESVGTIAKEAGVDAVIVTVGG